MFATQVTINLLHSTLKKSNVSYKLILDSERFWLTILSKSKLEIKKLKPILFDPKMLVT